MGTFEKVAKGERDMQGDNKKKAWAQLIDKRIESVEAVRKKKDDRCVRHGRAVVVLVACTCHVCAGNPEYDMYV